MSKVDHRNKVTNFCEAIRLLCMQEPLVSATVTIMVNLTFLWCLWKKERCFVVCPPLSFLLCLWSHYGKKCSI